MLYFAYGSNLWLRQMAQRCPNSRLIGRGILPDYEWQINERGYANVIPYPGCGSVHGPVYSIEAGDEARLDINEGVYSGAYEKTYRSVILYPAAPKLQKHADDLMRALDAHRGHHTPSEQRPQLESMLVYISTTFVRPGTPGEEYVHRINSGIQDAVALGIPPAYVENVVRRWVRPAPDQAHRPGRPDRAAAPPARRSSKLGWRRGSKRSSLGTLGDSQAGFAADCTPPSRPAASTSLRCIDHRGREVQVQPLVIDGDQTHYSRM